MKNKINIQTAEIKNRELLLKTDNHLDMHVIEPMKQMLVDSDNVSFVYIVDYREAYTYISIPESIWSLLKTALDENAKVFLKTGEGCIHLPNFLEELHELIENIKGNSNYGERMVGKVEGVFSNPV